MQSVSSCREKDRKGERKEPQQPMPEEDGISGTGIHLVIVPVEPFIARARASAPGNVDGGTAKGGGGSWLASHPRKKNS